jgi:hypothetical protein
LSRVGKRLFERFTVSEQSYLDDARFLMGLGRPGEKPETYFDEDESITHELGHDVLSISTHFVDYTTYIVTRVGPDPDSTFTVHVERLDNYRLHEKAQKITCPIDADEEDDLAEMLARLVEQVKVYQAKQQATAAETTLLDAMMLPAGEWEWTAWSHNGTPGIQHALDEHKIAVKLDYPTEKEEQKVFASANFSKSTLEWFRKQLIPHGWTLVAVAPFDEYQAFALIKRDDLDTVRALLKKHGRKIK